MWKKFISRKLIVAVLGSLSLYGLNIPPDVIAWIAGVIITYLAGQTVVDVAEAKAKTVLELGTKKKDE